MKIIKKNSKTKEKLLEAAQKIMMDKGFVAASIDEICQEAQLTKGSLFHYFKTKEDLGLAVLKHFSQYMFELRKSSLGNETDPLKQVFLFINFFLTLSEDPQAIKGCLIGTFAQEISTTHPNLRDCCRESFKENAEFFKKILDMAKFQHMPNKELDTLSLSEYFISVVQGSIIMAKTKQDISILKRNIIHFRSYIEILFRK